MKALTKEVICSVNNKIEDIRITDFLDKVVNDLEEKQIEISNYVKIILTMLVSQLILYYKAADAIFGSTQVSSKDNYDRKAKAPEISVMQKSHDQILNLLDKISLSPLSAAKIKKLNQDDSEDTAEKLLSELVA